MAFSLENVTPLGRKGVLETKHGTIDTPFFLPVGTAGAMKGLTHEDLLDLGAQVLLCNTYHLHLQPGEDVISDAGGLHAFIGWDKPTLTDSGGFQVFSLRAENRITDDGVHFRNYRNGDPLFMGPEESMAIQLALGADIIMAFDECPPSTASRGDIERAVDRTLRWAKRCKEIHAESGSAALLFGIVQGGLERDLREKCAEEIIAIGFDGYAIGGLAVGEPPEEMAGVLDLLCPLLPENRPRYLMGVGVLNQLSSCVAKGIDMFDCVHPMRTARHGTIFMSDGSSVHIENAEFESDHSPIDPDSPSNLSRTHKKSYLHHLFRAGERLAETIAAKQNLGVTLKLMRDLRERIGA